MKHYKELLAFQPILNQNIIKMVEELQQGTLSKVQFHNKKSYAKKKSDLVTVLECSIAFEIYQIIKGEYHA